MKSRLFLFFLYASVLLSACMDVSEEMTINKNGSGTYSLTLAFSNAKDSLRLGKDTVFNLPLPNKEFFLKELKNLEQQLRSAPGIEGSGITANWEQNIFSVRFNFNKLSSLQALADSVFVAHKIDRRRWLAGTAYSQTDSSFSRNSNDSLQANYTQLKETDQAFFEASTYLSMIRFPDKIASVSNPLAKISSDGYAVMLRLAVIDILSGRMSLGNTIVFALQ